MAATIALSFSVVPATAVPLPSELCTAFGQTDITIDRSTGIASWIIKGGDGGCTEISTGLIESCDEPYYCGGSPPPFTISGSGTSTGIGLCDTSLLKKLKLKVTLEIPYEYPNLPGSGGYDTYTEHQIWKMPAPTTFPLATPFEIREPGSRKLEGVGVMTFLTRNQCSPDHWHLKTRFELIFA
jgi:hypothetical protein